MEMSSEFAEFLTGVRPTKNQRDDMKTGHATLRRRLLDDEKLAPIIVSTFLQGSYRRHTAHRPKGDKKSDVDIIVVTTLAEADYTPEEAMALFKPFLDRHYKGKWTLQGRSIGIELSYVKLDLVITSAPSESQARILKSDAVVMDDVDDDGILGDWRLNEAWIGVSSRQTRSDARELLKAAKAKPEWQVQPLRIPDREAEEWDDTHPLEQIRWTRDKNAATDGHFINVVKAIKWSRIVSYPDTKYPKGFPVERMIGDCCPDGIGSVAEGIVKALEAMVSNYSEGKPVLPDYGVPEHDVLKRLSDDDFATFYEQVKSAAVLARAAFDSTDRAESSKLWRDLLGDKFPKVEKDNGGKKAGFEEPTGPASPGSGRFA